MSLLRIHDAADAPYKTSVTFIVSWLLQSQPLGEGGRNRQQSCTRLFLYAALLFPSSLDMSDALLRRVKGRELSMTDTSLRPVGWLTVAELNGYCGCIMIPEEVHG